MINWIDKTKAALVTGTVHGAIIGFMLLSFNWNTAKLSAGGPPPTIQARVIDPNLVAAELANLKAIEQQRRQAEQQRPPLRPADPDGRDRSPSFRSGRSRGGRSR